MWTNLQQVVTQQQIHDVKLEPRHIDNYRRRPVTTSQLVKRLLTRHCLSTTNITNTSADVTAVQ